MREKSRFHFRGVRSGANFPECGPAGPGPMERYRFAVEQGLVVARQQGATGRGGHPLHPPSRQRLEETDLIVSSERAGIDDEHRPFGVQTAASSTVGIARPTSISSLSQSGPLRFSVRLENDVPVDLGLVGHVLQRVEEQPLEVDQLPPGTCGTVRCMPGRNALGFTSRLRNDTFLDRMLELFLELPGVGFLRLNSLSRQPEIVGKRMIGSLPVVIEVTSR